MQFESHQAECSIPWLNEILVFLTVTLQLCQQLKDKVCIRFVFLPKTGFHKEYQIINSAIATTISQMFSRMNFQNNFFPFLLSCRFQCFPNTKILLCWILDQRPSVTYEWQMGGIRLHFSNLYAKYDCYKKKCTNNKTYVYYL